MAVVAVTGLAFGATTSERAAAAARLVEQNAILKGVTEGTTDAVFVKDLQGRYLMVNPAGARFAGMPVEEILGRDDREIFSSEAADEIRERDRRIMIEGETATVEERISAAGTTRTFLSTKGPYIDEDGAVIGLIGISRDITEQKAAEEERRELLERERLLRAAADRSNRQKDEFLGLLGHELRNPLAPIRNALEIVRKDPGEETLVWALDVMERQVLHLSRLVDDLLDVSRITTGRIELRMQPLDLRAVIERSIEASEPWIHSREHRLELSLPLEPLLLFADATRLEQVFVNLLNNSAKYTETGGRIWVLVERQGSEALVRVRDSGQGISAALLPHVFDLFTQAERSLDRSEGGLGVGLALVRKLVELHGGSVCATSEGAGRGSEFTVRLPVAPEQTRNQPMDSDKTPEQARGLRVLVVEDNLDSARSLAALLRLQGHEVEVVHDGRNAVETAGRFGPSVVLLDIGLPGVDGYEIARQLRTRGSKAVLVSLTGYGRESDRRKSAEAGCDHHLLKPVEPEVLKRLLASIAPS
jgi:PAS domain S-box-containing protein